MATPPLTCCNGAEDGIRTHDPHLGMVRGFVLLGPAGPRSAVRPPSFQTVHRVRRCSRALSLSAQLPKHGRSEEPRNFAVAAVADPALKRRLEPDCWAMCSKKPLDSEVRQAAEKAVQWR